MKHSTSESYSITRCASKTVKPILTNEEYLRSCTTEQLVEWIAEQKCDGCNDEPYNEKHGTCKYCMTKKTEQIRAWLKQPHREEKHE